MSVVMDFKSEDGERKELTNEFGHRCFIRLNQGVVECAWSGIGPRVSLLQLDAMIELLQESRKEADKWFVR